MLQSMHSQLFVVLLYPPAGCCRISCWYSLVLRKMPGIDGAGSQYLPIQYLSNTSPTMPRVIAISGPIKPTGGLRQLPDIPPVPLGAPENGANRQALAGANSQALAGANSQALAGA